MSTDMTPIERLRAAEALLRKRTGKATSGRWFADHDYDTLTAHPFKSAREAYDSTDTTGSPFGDPFVIPEGDGGSVRDDDLDYIAMMSPPIALALAEVIGAELRRHGNASTGFGGVRLYFMPPEILALADALLGVTG